MIEALLSEIDIDAELNIDVNNYFNEFLDIFNNGSDENVIAVVKQARSNPYLVARCAIALVDYITTMQIPRQRLGNVHGERREALEYVHRWDDDMFRRQFRMRRTLFYRILADISPLLQVDDEMARRSSGSAINSEMQLMITCRILAGESYLDMIWYRVSVNHVMDLAVKVCSAICKTFNNIRFPTEEAELRRIADRWKFKQVKRWGHETIPNLVCAGDGVVFEIAAVRESC